MTDRAGPTQHSHNSLRIHQNRADTKSRYPIGFGMCAIFEVQLRRFASRVAFVCVRVRIYLNNIKYLGNRTRTHTHTQVLFFSVFLDGHTREDTRRRRRRRTATDRLAGLVAHARHAIVLTESTSRHQPPPHIHTYKHAPRDGAASCRAGFSLLCVCLCVIVCIHNSSLCST